MKDTKRRLAYCTCIGVFLLVLQMPGFTGVDHAPKSFVLGWVVQKGTLRPEVPPWCEPSWAHLMHACWRLDPAQRPSFRSMALELEHLIELLTAHTP